MQKILLTLLFAVTTLPATALAQSGESAEAALKRAELLAKEGRTEEALRSYFRAMALNPHDAATMVNIGRMLAQSGRLEEARKMFDRAVQLTGDKGAAAEQAKIGLIQLDRALADRKDRLERENVELEARLKVLEYELRARKMKDEDVARRLAKERDAYGRKDKAAEVDPQKLVRLWKRNGLTEEEIQRRMDEWQASRKKSAAARLRYSELEKTLFEDARIAMEEAERRLALERDRADLEAFGDWKLLRNDELRAARLEFLRLGKLLGVSPEAAEALLEKAQKGRTTVKRFGWDETTSTRKNEIEEVRSRLDEMSSHLQNLERRLATMLDRLTERMAELERRLK